MSATDPADALQAGIYELLAGDAELGALVTGIHDGEAPEGAARDYVVIGAMSSTPDGAHDGEGRVTLAELHTWAEASGFRSVNAIGARLVALLWHGHAALDPLVDGQHVWRVEHELAQTMIDPQPGVRHRVDRFRVWSKNDSQAPTGDGGGGGGTDPATPTTPELLQEFVQTDAVTQTLTLAGMAHPIAVGSTAVLVNASTIDNDAATPGLGGWGGIVEMADSKGNRWARLATGPLADGINSGTTVELWTSVLEAELGNGDTLTVTGDARGLSMVASLLDVGTLAASPLDVTGVGAASSWHAPFTDPPTAPTAQDAELVLAATAIGDGGGATITPAAGWAVLSDHGDATVNRQLQVAWQTAAAGTPLAFHADTGTDNAHAFQVVLVALKTS